MSERLAFGTVRGGKTSPLSWEVVKRWGMWEARGVRANVPPAFISVVRFSACA